MRMKWSKVWEPQFSKKVAVSPLKERTPKVDPWDFVKIKRTSSEPAIKDQQVLSTPATRSENQKKQETANQAFPEDCLTQSAASLSIGRGQ